MGVVGFYASLVNGVTALPTSQMKNSEREHQITQHSNEKKSLNFFS